MGSGSDDCAMQSERSVEFAICGQCRGIEWSSGDAASSVSVRSSSLCRSDCCGGCNRGWARPSHAVPPIAGVTAFRRCGERSDAYMHGHAQPEYDMASITGGSVERMNAQRDWMYEFDLFADEVAMESEVRRVAKPRPSRRDDSVHAVHVTIVVPRCCYRCSCSVASCECDGRGERIDCRG